MARPIKISGPAFLRDTDVVLLGRIVRREDFDEQDIVVSDIASVKIRVFLEGEQVGTDEDPVPSTVFFDDLQTGEIWTKDDEGFNFMKAISHDYFTVSGSYKVQVDVVLADADSQHCHAVYQLSARALPEDGEV